jgi:uncharacterized protein YndB with AHSA1/START domain
MNDDCRIMPFEIVLAMYMFALSKKNKNHKTMETATKTVIDIKSTINAPVSKVWDYWTSPEHIVRWNSPSEDWHTPRAENDLRDGGKFLSRMEAKDGSFGFDFAGTYDKVVQHEIIDYTLGDGRRVHIRFAGTGNETNVDVDFEAEDINPIDMQRGGWQSILDNFRKYTEAN